MPFHAPFRMGPFTCDCEGRLSPFEEGGMPAFLFRWRGRCVHARLAQVGAREGRLVLEATLGRVPSTASVLDETLRARSFAVSRWLPRAVPSEWRIRLLADHRVWLETDTAIGLPITASGLIAELTRFLLDLGPYLDLLDEGGLTTVGSGGAARPG